MEILKLTLRELEALASSRTSRFFALTHTWVAGQQAIGLEERAICLVELIESSGNGKA